MVNNVSLKQFSDLNGDGKVNNADRHMAAGGEDANGDGKITSEDFFYVRGGKEDYNGDGKINWLDVNQARLDKKGIFAEADADGDGKLSSSEWQEHAYASKYEDVNGDGKINWHDSWITKAMEKEGISDAFAFDADGDGKINTEDYWMHKGYEDYNNDGKVNMQDKVYKDTYGDVSLSAMQGAIKTTNFSELAEKIETNTPAKIDEPTKPFETVRDRNPDTYKDTTANEKLNILKYGVNHLADLQKELGIKPSDNSSMLPNLPGAMELGSGSDVAVKANKFNTNELYFLTLQNSLTYNAEATTSEPTSMSTYEQEMAALEEEKEALTNELENPSITKAEKTEIILRLNEITI